MLHGQSGNRVALEAVYLCQPGWEHALRDELNRGDAGAAAEVLQPGWVASHAPAETAVPAFARQCLPRPLELQADSINAWARQAVAAAESLLHAHQGPWRLHVASVPIPGGNAGPRRCALVRSAIMELLRKQRRKLLAACTADDSQPWQAGEALWQVALRTAGSGYVSLAAPELRHALRRVVSRFCGGVLEVPPDRKAPSRADQKLREALTRLGRNILPGEQCVDLGASPGGWSYVALRQGASVTAVDRAPLRADLMAHPRLSYLRRDAFRFEPESPVDWLLCDVIAFPEKIVQLLARWLQRGWCRRFCVTVKFRGRTDDAALDALKRLLAQHAAESCLRRLCVNKNEVTAYGCANEEGATEAAC